MQFFRIAIFHVLLVVVAPLCRTSVDDFSSHIHLNFINKKRKDCLDSCNSEEDKCLDECTFWKESMAESSGFHIYGNMLFPYHRPTEDALTDMKRQARIITRFEESCLKKCSYSGASCSIRCDGDAMDAIQQLPPNGDETWQAPPPSSSQDGLFPSSISAYIKQCKDDCRSLKQRCVSRLQKSGLAVGDAYFVCASVEDECQSVCEENAAKMLSDPNIMHDKQNSISSLSSLFPDLDISSAYIDLSLLRPSIAQQLFGTHKTPARRQFKPDQERSDELGRNLTHTLPSASSYIVPTSTDPPSSGHYAPSAPHPRGSTPRYPTRRMAGMASPFPNSDTPSFLDPVLPHSSCHSYALHPSDLAPQSRHFFSDTSPSPYYKPPPTPTYLSQEDLERIASGVFSNYRRFI